MAERLVVVLLSAIASVVPVSADIFKCRDDSGRTIYQATSCNAGQTSLEIDHQYSNSLPLGVSEEDALQVSRIASDAENALKERRARHNAYMRRIVRDFEERRAACEARRSRLDEVRAAQRLRGRNNPDELSEAIADMRDACSS
ncbi:MAG: DUF4124 domain-containing protein [Pseudomonadota bacterium]